MKVIKIIFLTLAMSVLSGPSFANSEVTKQFRDWRAICDDSGNCKGVTVDTRRNNTTATYRLEIERKSGRDNFWTISFVINGDEPRTYEPFHISVDFEQPLNLEPDEDYKTSDQANTFEITGVSQGNQLMRLFAGGNETYFNFLNTKGQETAAKFSLKGLTATLLWIDDQQNRLNSPRTIGDIKTVSSDGNSATANPYTSGNTIIHAPGKMPPAIARLHFNDGTCTSIERGPLSNFGFKTARLDKTNKLYLIPCFAAAYNVVYRVYITASNADEPRQLFFANFSDEMGWGGTNELLNISYDAKTKTLITFAKGRGLGDCGSTSILRWNDYDFQLVEYRYWGKCDGTRQAGDWPVIYKAPKP